MSAGDQTTAPLQTSAGDQTTSRLARTYERWCEYWFEPQETSTLGLIRIAFGIVVLAWTLTMLPDLRAFFTSGGWLPKQPPLDVAGAWGPLSLASSYTAVLVACIVLAVAALCMALGICTRPATILVWLGVLAFTRRNPYVTNSGDLYIRVIAFYLILTPAGASLSLRRWLRERDRFWEFPRRSLWGVRLLQIQVSVLYLTAVWDKVSTGPLWNSGTALSYILRIKDVARFPTPGLATNSLDVNFMTYGTLAIELSLGVLIWNRRLRPYIVVLGILLHLSIEYTIRVGFFSMLSIIAICSFVSPAVSKRAILFVRDRVGRPRRRLAAPAGTD